LKAVKNDRGVSYLEEVNATFFHFIMVQVITLLWAFIYRGTALYDLVVQVRSCWPFATTLFAIVRAAGGFVGYLIVIAHLPGKKVLRWDSGYDSSCGWPYRFATI